MPRGRSLAGVLALVALSWVVGGIWWAAMPSDAPEAPRPGDAEAATDDASAAGAAGRPAAKRTRKRAYVRTDEDVRRDAAREALVAAAVQIAKSPDAGPNVANVRPMVLPGTRLATPAGWTPADVRLTARQSSASVLALDARPGSRTLPRVGRLGDARIGTAGWGLSSNFRSGPDEVAPENPEPARHGLRADVYDFLDGMLTEVPDLAALPPTLTRVDAAIDFDTDESFALAFEPDTFGVLWRGFLIVETPGEYEFTAGSDDGVRVTIAGTNVLEFTWLRPYAETGGTIRLDAGRHPIEVAFYENYGFASCRLFWTPPGATSRSLVPASAFAPPDEVAAADPPYLQSVTPGHGRIGDEVVIRGSGFSASAGLNRVTFAGAVAEVVSAEPDALVVKVPIGASTGPLVVQVGPISTRPRHFEVDNLLGLYGEYFLVGTELSDYPDFNAIAPYFVRLDGPLAFVEDDLWQMPYDPDVFAVRWSGFLYVPEEDEYEITLLSDDGAYVSIDDERVVDLPGLHPPMEASRTVALTQGFHPIEIRFFENLGLAHLALSWRRRGEPSRTPIPRGFLFAPDALANRAEPVVAAIEPATAVSGDEIVIRGSGFGTDARVVRVEFPGEAWKRPDLAADDLIRVRVPHGVRSGGLRVHVGVRVSEPWAFTLGEPIGLRGDYFDLGAENVASAAALPDLLASRAPTVSRIDTRFRYGKTADWGLTFADRPFAVRWTGTIAVETTQNLLVALQSESAALLRIDGGDVVADVEPHTLREVYGSGRLTPGEHRIELWSLHSGDPRLHVFITPAGRMDHLEVEPAWLRPRPPR